MFGMLDYRAYKLRQLIWFPFMVTAKVLFFVTLAISILIAHLTPYNTFVRILIAYVVFEAMLLLCGLRGNAAIGRYCRLVIGCRREIRIAGARMLSILRWRIGAAAVLIWWAGHPAANGQSRPGDAYSQMIEAVCRGYAAAVTVQPPDRSFAQCMAERECFVSTGSSIYQCKPPEPPLISRGKE